MVRCYIQFRKELRTHVYQHDQPSFRHLDSRLVLLTTTPARADVTLLVGAPYGPFGSLSPTGHAAVYFKRICAESPIVRVSPVTDHEVGPR